MLWLGFRRFSDDIEMMIGHKPNYYWIVCWLVLTPVMVAVRLRDWVTKFLNGTLAQNRPLNF